MLSAAMDGDPPPPGGVLLLEEARQPLHPNPLFCPEVPGDPPFPDEYINPEIVPNFPRATQLVSGRPGIKSGSL